MENDVLNDYVVKQFNYSKFREMVITFLSLIDVMKFMISDYNAITITPSYEMKCNCFVGNTTSKIESFIIQQYNTEEKLKECLTKYSIAFNMLNEIEKKVFVKSFIEKLKDSITCMELDIHTVLLLKIRKSAVIKFALALGFDKIDF